jgi:hypothetical protein
MLLHRKAQVGGQRRIALCVVGNSQRVGRSALGNCMASPGTYVTGTRIEVSLLAHGSRGSTSDRLHGIGDLFTSSL